jgi:nucleotide-binding universal stress UspA family protein
MANTQGKLPRIEFKRILYVTDLSEAGRQAFPYAASLAHQYLAELTVFHVVESHEFEKYLVGYISEDMWNEIKTRNLREARDLIIRRKRDDAAIKDTVEQFCQDTIAGQRGQPYVTYDVVVEMGDPVDKITTFAREGGYDLVVISKHGHGIIHGGLMGDTVSRVMRRCEVPVLVAQALESGDD